MSGMWREAYDNDIMSSGIVKELIAEMGTVTINNEKPGMAIGNIPGLRVKDSLYPLPPNDLG